MATLTEPAYHSRESFSSESYGLKVVQTGEALVVGQFVQHGTNPNEIQDLQNNATDGFAGYMDGHAAPGEQAKVYERIRLVLSINSAVAAGDEGTALYADTSGTASNNPADITTTNTNNLPIGKIYRVETAGAAGANRVVVEVRADGDR